MEDAYADNMTSLEREVINETSRSSSAPYLMCKREEFYIYSVAAGTVCLFGFLANALSFWGLRKDRQTPTASFLLQLLAFIDNVFLLLWFLHFALIAIFDYFDLQEDLHYSWHYVRVYSYPLLFIAQTATIWVTVLIAVSRYIAICQPHRSVQVFNNMRRVRKASIGVVVFSFVYNLPRFFESKLEMFHDNGTIRILHLHTAMAESSIYRLFYFDILYYVFSFVLPLLIVTVLNTRLMFAYRKIVQRRRLMCSRSTDGDHNITLVLIIVVAVFMLCQAPARIVQIVWSYEFKSCTDARTFIIIISNVLEVLNSSANFIIYCAFRKRFRDILQTELCIFTNGAVRGEAAGDDTLVQEPLTNTAQNGKNNWHEVKETECTQLV